MLIIHEESSSEPVRHVFVQGDVSFVSRHLLRFQRHHMMYRKCMQFPSLCLAGKGFRPGLCEHFVVSQLKQMELFEGKERCTCECIYIHI